jgi:hypothetical protein
MIISLHIVQASSHDIAMFFVLKILYQSVILISPTHPKKKEKKEKKKEIY